jgi:hypothetical protein
VSTNAARGPLRRIGLRLLGGVLGLIALAVLLIVIGAALCARTRPDPGARWGSQYSVMPSATIDGDRVVIRGVRNAHYAQGRADDLRYETRTYDLNRLDSAWFIISPFSRVAHTFVSFGFGPDEFVAVSVEARRPPESSGYSPLRGLYPQYGLMYVIADERDAVTLRARQWHDPVYIYPIRTTRERMRKAFVSMVTRASALRDSPEWYNTITNNCTTNLVDHVNAISPGRLHWELGLLLNADADRVAYERGLIETTLPLDAARRRFRSDDCARRVADDATFSRMVRVCTAESFK